MRKKKHGFKHWKNSILSHFRQSIKALDTDQEAIITILLNIAHQNSKRFSLNIHKMLTTEP